MNRLRLFLILLVGGTLCLLVAVPIYYGPIQTMTVIASPGPDVIWWGPELVVATRDLPIGTTIFPGMITTCPWSYGLAPELSLVSLDAVVGRKTRVEIFRGTTVIVTQLSDETSASHTAPGTQTASFTCPSMDRRADIVLAHREIKQGETISKESVSTETWALAAVPPGAAKTSQNVIGRTALSLIPNGTAILDSQLSGS